MRRREGLALTAGTHLCYQENMQNRINKKHVKDLKAIMNCLGLERTGSQKGT